jgi:tetratricopeptide (TPR) repeat protein
VAVTVSLPLVVLVLLEICLRLGGYGYDPGFFITETDASGKKFLRSNDSFMFRFFPPERARWPVAFRFEMDKPPDVKRIFIFGESAAMGDPQPSVGPSHILEVLLRERLPDQKFEVINLGITAINSHVILPIAQDVAAQGRGDIWLVYMGNNEMVGPFGAASVFRGQATPLPMVRINLAIQKMRTGQILMSAMNRIRGQSTKAAWGGMEMFLRNQVPPGDVRRETVYRSFERNLRELVREGHRSGAKLVLSTVAVNLRDCPPFASLGASHLPAADRDRYDALYAAATRLQANQECAGAVALLQQAAQIDPQVAELHFRWGQCLLGDTNSAAAREHLQLACDLDALPFRADSRINGAIRSLAQEMAGIELVLCDAEQLLAAGGPGGTAGAESFFEHVHFNFDGNYRLARAWGEQVAGLLGSKSAAVAHSDWPDQEFCERAIGLSDLNRASVLSTVLSRLRQPPLSTQLNNALREATLRADLAALTGRQRQADYISQTSAAFDAALSLAPANPLLRQNYAVFLESAGDAKGALAQYARITERLPHDYNAVLQSGRLLGQLGDLAGAERSLRKAMAQRPTLPDAAYQLGIVLAAAGRHREALECFNQVARTHPSDTACLIYRARVLSKLNRRVEAMESYGRVLQLNADNWQAHLELAEELVLANRLDEACAHYRQAVRLNPRHPVMRVNLGVVMARLNRVDEAIEQFESALRLDPANVTAQEYLRQVLLRREGGSK